MLQDDPNIKMLQKLLVFCRANVKLLPPALLHTYVHALTKQPWIIPLFLGIIEDFSKPSKGFLVLLQYNALTFFHENFMMSWYLAHF